MKSAQKAALVLACASLFGCASAPDKNSPTWRVSPDYMATGTSGDIRAYVYGDTTVIELQKDPTFLSIKNGVGESVSFEKIGRHYRLKQRLDKFTVSANGQTIEFSAIPKTQVFSAPFATVEKAGAITLALQTPAPINKDGADVQALIKLADAQLAELRKAVEAASKDSKTTGATLFKLSARLDEIQARYATAAAAVVQVRFSTASTSLKISPRIESVLVKSAKEARLVNLRGYTDSRVAGSLDAKIAQGRVSAVRKLLVANGVEGEKITIASFADGGFIAPNTTKKGRALNRRVEIEFIDSRIGELKGGVVMVAASKTK